MPQDGDTDELFADLKKSHNITTFFQKSNFSFDLIVRVKTVERFCGLTASSKPFHGSPFPAYSRIQIKSANIKTVIY